MQSLRAAASHLWSKAAGDPSSTPIERLVPFPWRTELAFVCAGMLASFLIAGFWYPYWRIADMDFWIVYNGFLLNAGLPQEYFDPGKAVSRADMVTAVMARCKAAPDLTVDSVFMDVLAKN